MQKMMFFFPKNARWPVRPEVEGDLDESCFEVESVVDGVVELVELGRKWLSRHQLVGGQDGRVEGLVGVAGEEIRVRIGDERVSVVQRLCQW